LLYFIGALNFIAQSLVNCARGNKSALEKKVDERHEFNTLNWLIDWSIELKFA
jgi:hypothetical protein